MVSGLINAAYPYAPAGGIVTTVAGNIPQSGVVAFNLPSCPAGWQLADGTGGTPDLRGIFIRGAGTHGTMTMANGTNFSATYGEYSNDSFQEHSHSVGAGSEFIYTGTGSNGLTSSPTGGTVTSSSYTGESALRDAAYGNPRTGAETVPASYALIYCVKTAEDSDTSNSIWQTLADGVVSLVNSSADVKLEGNLNVSGNLTVTGGVDFNNSDSFKSGLPIIIWRLNTDVTNDDTPLGATGNEWELADDTENENILGSTTEITESSGIFSFGSTGYWLVHYIGQHSAEGASNTILELDSTDDNSTYTPIASSRAYIAAVGTSGNTGGYALIKVTNTSNDKIRLSWTTSHSTGKCHGDTSNSETHIVFEKKSDL